MSRFAIFIIILFLLQPSLGFDFQKHIEYEHALNYIIHLVKESRLSDFEDSELKRCTESKCCVCGV
jgi:hypothetical protein